jgi:hypothetical protein
MMLYLRAYPVLVFGAFAAVLVACGGHVNRSSDPYRPKPTAACLRMHGYLPVAVGELKPTVQNGNRIGIVNTVVTNRKVSVLFYAGVGDAIADSKTFHKYESSIVATDEPKYRVALRRYMESANYRIGTVFVAWAGIGESGGVVTSALVTDRSRAALASCLRH